MKKPEQPKTPCEIELLWPSETHGKAGSRVHVGQLERDNLVLSGFAVDVVDGEAEERHPEAFVPAPPT